MDKNYTLKTHFAQHFSGMKLGKTHFPGMKFGKTHSGMKHNWAKNTFSVKSANLFFRKECKLKSANSFSGKSAN
jgi:hypothetical protein